MIADILSAVKQVLLDLGVQVYDFVPDSQNLPCVIIYPENIDLDVPNRYTIVIWCLAGRIDEQFAQSQLSDWLDPVDGQITTALLADSTLGGTVGSLLALNVRNWQPAVVADGRPAYWQAQLVCEVI